MKVRNNKGLIVDVPDKWGPKQFELYHLTPVSGKDEEVEEETKEVKSGGKK